jgi:hypothetical protein
MEVISKSQAEDGHGYYVIEEEADVDELIRQIKKSGEFTDE